MNTNPENDPEALFQKGKAHYAERKYEEAIKCFRKAARRKHAGAQCYLGLCYLNGEGVPQDDGEAVKLFCKAAEQGHAGAQYNLALCYRMGRGVEVQYSRFSANEFDGKRFTIPGLIAIITDQQIPIPEAPTGLERLNNMLSGPCLYSRFRYIPLPKWAEDLVNRESTLSSEERIALNRFILEVAYRKQCPKKCGDIVEAYKWMTVSAPMNNKHALNRLDEMESWMTEDQIAEGHFRIGKMYAKGEGVPKDLVEAHARASLAVSTGWEEAKEYRDTLEKTLTTEQIKDARRRLVWYQNPRKMRLTDKTELKQIEDARWRGHGELRLLRFTDKPIPELPAHDLENERLMRFTEKGTPEPPADARRKPDYDEESRQLFWANG